MQKMPKSIHAGHIFLHLFDPVLKGMFLEVPSCSVHSSGLMFVFVVPLLPHFGVSGMQAVGSPACLDESLFLLLLVFGDLPYVLHWSAQRTPAENRRDAR